MQYRRPIVLWAIFVAGVMLSLAEASTVRADDLQGQTRQDFINALTPTTRGLSVSDGSPHKDMRIQFEFGSAELTNSARAVLDELGAALQSNELSTFEFSLVGHTDAVGSETVNLELSKARAQAVKEYLIDKFKIGAERLQADGVGKSDLADPNNPTSGLNRRVVITNLGS
jgi:outer membrane protein OmpA-like peptidoglycan-associated protein